MAWKLNLFPKDSRNCMYCLCLVYMVRLKSFLYDLFLENPENYITYSCSYYCNIISFQVRRRWLQCMKSFVHRYKPGREILQVSVYYVKGTAKTRSYQHKWEPEGIFCSSPLPQSGFSRGLRELRGVCNKPCHYKWKFSILRSALYSIELES